MLIYDVEVEATTTYRLTVVDPQYVQLIYGVHPKGIPTIYLNPIAEYEIVTPSEERPDLEDLVDRGGYRIDSLDLACALRSSGRYWPANDAERARRKEFHQRIAALQARDELHWPVTVTLGEILEIFEAGGATLVDDIDNV